MPGPRPMPTRLKLLRGNPGKRAIRKGFEPPQPPSPLDAPEFLTGYARQEWDRVAPGLHLFGLLTTVDIMVLGAYCEAFQTWRTATEAFDRMAELDPGMHGLLVRGSEGQARPNPLTKIAADAAADMVRFASEFGFGPAARSRIAGGPPPNDGKFAGLLAYDDDNLA